MSEDQPKDEQEPTLSGLEEKVDQLLAASASKTVGDLQATLTALDRANKSTIKEYAKDKLKKYTGFASDFVKGLGDMDPKAAGEALKNLYNEDVKKVIEAIPELKAAIEERKKTIEEAKKAKAGDRIRTTKRAWDLHAFWGAMKGGLFVSMLFVILIMSGVV